MALIRVFGNTHLNPDHVGKVTVEPQFTEDTRTTTTTVYDATGQHVMLEAKTVVATGENRSDPDAVQRDNFAHAEIIEAIKHRRDAGKYHETPVTGL